MLDAEPLLMAFGTPAPRRALKDEDYFVVRQLRRHELIGQAPRRAGTVAPPAVRPAAHDVRAVDDEDAHVSPSSGSAKGNPPQALAFSHESSRV
jgi:hypothetical protein